MRKYFIIGGVILFLIASFVFLCVPVKEEWHSDCYYGEYVSCFGSGEDVTLAQMAFGKNFPLAGMLKDLLSDIVHGFDHKTKN